MGGPAFAAVASMCFALGYIASKRGLQSSSVVGGVLVSLVATWVVTLVAVALDPPESISVAAVVLFGCSGLVAPGISRVADLAGVDRLGPSVSVPIQSGARPLLAVLSGALLLGERVTVLRALGVVAIVLGVWNLTRPEPPENDPPASAGTSPVGTRRLRTMLRPGVVFPIIAGASFAGSDVLKKEGLAQSNETTFGALVAITAALLTWLVLSYGPSRLSRRAHLGPGAYYFVASGALTALALLSLFAALQRADVSVVGPISSSSPLAIFAFSALFLRGIETITPRIVLAGVSVVAGATLVALSG